MTTSPARGPSKVRALVRWFLAGTLLAAVTAAVVLYSFRSRTVPPVPPGEDVDGLEPAVAEIIHNARSRVLDQPDSAQAWGTLGEVFLANELEEESSLCFARAQQIDPDDPRWPYFRAGTLLNQGAREEAVPYLQRAVARGEAEEPALRLLLGETLLTLGRLDEAEDHFRGILTRQPDNPRVHFNLGLVAMSRQDWKTAREHLLRCLGSPTARQKARVQLAIVCRRLGDQEKANEYHQQARTLPKDSDWPDSFIEEYLRWAVKKKNRYRLAEYHESAGRFAKAIAILQPMTEQYPDDYLPFFTLGKLLGQTGDAIRAETALRKALQLAPDKVQTHYYLSLVLFTQGESLAQQKDSDPARSKALYEESIRLARKAISIQPDYGFAYMSLGLSLKRLGQRHAALDALAQAVRCVPDKAELHFYLGETLAEAGQSAAARARLEHALKIADPHASWRKSAEARLRALPRPDGKQAP